MDNHRHVQRGIVNKKTVVFFAVLAKAFPVIASEHDNGVSIQAIRLEKSNKPAYLRVRKSNFAVVRTLFVLFAVGSRRPIGIVRVVEMHPEKEFALPILTQPVQRHVGDHIARTLQLLQIRLLQPVEIEVIVVEVESLVQPKARVQDGRADDRPCGVPVLFENGGQRRLAWIQLVAAEIMHAAERGIGSGEDDCVSWQRHRDWRVGALEAYSVASEGIDVRSADQLVAVASQVVRSQSVNGDYDDIGSSLHLGRRFAAEKEKAAYQ